MIGALAITQTAGYGILYYAFSVFIPPMSRDLHAGVAQLTGAFTLSALVSGLVAPLVGRRLDRHGGRGLMTAGSVLGALAVLAWSQVRTVAQLYLVCGVLGVASAMVLYEAAFAVIVAWFDAARRARALLAVTVVAGFASSIFLPLTGVLADRYGWRQALVILAAGYAVTAVPLHALAVRGRPAPAHVDRREIVGTALRERPFWLLAAAFLTQTGAVSVMGVLLVTYLITLGHPPVFAAGVAGLLGVLSVTGRLVTTGLQARWPVALITCSGCRDWPPCCCRWSGATRWGPWRRWCCSGWGSGSPRSRVPRCSPTGTGRPRTRRSAGRSRCRSRRPRPWRRSRPPGSRRWRGIRR
ncbi:MFS transporter [Nonomuraea sp. MG754425]|uniref:MFS transporter n=1 Tax=Nonomuraea sp. MG754425 TaxID=2570319 RepID=UPI001EFF618D|nr:MFS transporter [Nonomuraea sp. MG754425]